MLVSGEQKRNWFSQRGDVASGLPSSAFTFLGHGRGPSSAQSQLQAVH